MIHTLTRYLLIAFVVLAAISPMTSAAQTGGGPQHGLAMHGELLYPADFKHFSYANPDAPKGGVVRYAVLGSFDSLNPLIVKGAPAAAVRGFVYESLLARSLDEPFSLYGLLAESVETPDDRSWVAFTLNPAAKFSDGKPVTVDDVIYSHALLRDKGRPNHRSYYSKIAKVEKTGPRTVRFIFKDATDRELPLIMGLMPILPKHHLTEEAFQKTTLQPPLGSGPYQISKVEPGKTIEYQRNPQYWGRELPSQRGRNNFDTIRYEYFRDVNTMREAFAKGVYDVRGEGDPGRWALDYDFPAVQRGDVVKRTFQVQSPSGLSGLVFNTRRPAFSDIRVRRALVQLFDFEWLNQKLYHGLYVRTQSYFDRSDLSSHGKPASAAEKKLLEPWLDQIPKAILEGTHTFPQSDGRGRNRKNIRKAVSMLREAGYAIEGGKMINAKSGQQLSFEILTVTQSQNKLLNGFVQTMQKIGIAANLRRIDSSEFQRRKQSFDFDMFQFRWSASLSPGNEQNFRWSSAEANNKGSWNYAGAQNPMIDALIKAVLAARDRKEFATAVRAYDRALIAGTYAIPLFHLPDQWVAHWKHLAFPAKTSLYGYQLDTWWDTRVKDN